MGGGSQNQSILSWATVSGGDSNLARGYWSSIGGGLSNIINDSFGGIASGAMNLIDTSPSYSFIGEAIATISVPSNKLLVYRRWPDKQNHEPRWRKPPGEGTWWHVIGGGVNNKILTEIKEEDENYFMGASTIGGGEGNLLDGPWGVISGGDTNIISFEIPPQDDDGGDIMEADFIGSGLRNSIDTASDQSVIGGRYNHIAGAGTGGNSGTNSVSQYANRDFIGGGDHNDIFSPMTRQLPEAILS